MRSEDKGITFSNVVLNRGLYNNVVNINLGAYYFEPSDDGKTIDPALVITARLRMDLACATQLRDALDELLKKHVKAEQVESSIGDTLN